jgi:hypothetical protein
MKLDSSKVYVKFGKDSKLVDVKDLTIDNKPLGEILAHVAELQKAYTTLTDELKNAYIVKKDNEYIVEVDNELKRVKDLKVFEVKDLQMPLKYYKIEGNGIVVDKKKVGML